MNSICALVRRGLSAFGFLISAKDVMLRQQMRRSTGLPMISTCTPIRRSAFTISAWLSSTRAALRIPPPLRRALAAVGNTLIVGDCTLGDPGRVHALGGGF